MGLFDDLLQPNRSTQPRRLGLFDDLLGESSEPEEDQWERRGIIERNLRTGETRPVAMPGALPGTGRVELGEDPGVVGPLVRRVADNLGGWAVGIAERAGEFGRENPNLSKVLVPPALRAAGSLIEPGTRQGMVENLDEERDRSLLHGDANKRALAFGAGEIGGTAAASILPGTGIGRIAAIERIGNPVARALAGGAAAGAEGAVQGFGDTAGLDTRSQIIGTALGGGFGALAGGAAAFAGGGRPQLDSGARVSLDVEPVQAPRDRGRGPSGLREGSLAGEPRVPEFSGQGLLENLPPRAGTPREAPRPRSIVTGTGDEVPLPPEVTFRGEADAPDAPWVGDERGPSHLFGEHFSESPEVATEYAAGYGERGRVREEKLAVQKPFSVARRYSYDEARKFGPDVAQRAAREMGADSPDAPIDGMAIHRGLVEDFLQKNSLDAGDRNAQLEALRHAHDRIKEVGYDAVHHVVAGKDAWAVPRRPAPSDLSPEIRGRDGVAFLSDNRPVPFRYVLRDADSVETSHTDAFTANPRFPHRSGAQPRDLSDPAERLKIESIAQQYNPARIGPSSSVSGDGAPFFARQTEGRPFMVVGNGRTIAQRQALNNPLKLAEHFEALKQQNAEAGFPEGFLEEAQRLGMRKPVIQRELLGDFDPEALGRDGNIGSTGRLSDLALSQSDAARMSPDLLSIIDGELPLDSAANRDFVRGFLGEVVPQVEHASMVGRAGELTVVGQRRIRNALLSAAFQDSEAIGKMVESDGEGIRNVGKGMLSSAARLAKQAQLAKAGVLYPRDIGPDVSQAARKLSELRGKSQPVEMYLKNGELYGQELTDEGRLLLEQFDLLKRDGSAVGGILRRYSELVESYGDPNQLSLMGPGDAPPKLEILREAVATWKQAEQPLLFPGGSAGLISSFADSLPGPLSIIANPAKMKALAVAGGKFVKRWLTNYGDVAALGDLAPEFAEKARLSVAQRTAEETRASSNLRDFDDGLERMMKSLREGGIARTEDDVISEALDGVMGRTDMAGLSPSLRAAATAMREHLDELTGGLLQDAMMSKDLRIKLENNLGEYLRRTYEIHRDPLAWEKVVKETEPWRWENAKRWASEQHPQWDEAQVEGYLNKFFQKQGDAALELAPRSDVFRIDKGIFKHRQQQHLVHMEDGPTRSYPTKEAAEKAAATSRDAGRKVTVESVDGMPEPLEQFLGLHMDPRARYSESVSKMAHDIATSKLMRELRAQGEGTIFFTQPTGEFATRMGGDPSFDPLAETFTSPEIKATLEAIQRGTAKGPAWLQKLAAVNALVRTGKTVGSPQTHVRNLLSWVPMLIANGHFSSVVNLPAFGRAVKTLAGGSRLTLEGRTHRMVESLADSLETVAGKTLADSVRLDIPALRAEHQRAVRLGIIKEGARSEEMARYLGILAETKLGKARGVEQLLKKATDSDGMMRALYGAEDDIGKLIAWNMERANYQWAHPEKSADEIAELTAPLVRDLYPTYSKAVPAVRAVRDFPFVGDFPTFWAEIGRTSLNVLKRGATELASDNPRLKLVGAKRLAGFGTAIAAPAIAKALFSARSGVSEQELEAVSEFVPEWNRYSDLVPIEKKGPGRYSLVDASYINPYANAREGWNALMANGLRWDDRVEAAIGEAFAPFANEGIVAGTIVDVDRNRTDDGRQVYPEFGTREEKLWAISKHVAARFEPGAVGLYRDVKAGVTGEENPKTGRPVDLSKLAFSFFTGTRALEVDVPKRIMFQGHDLQGARRDIVARYNRVSKRKGASPSERLDAKISANDAWHRQLVEMQRRVERARTTGLSDYQIRRIFKEEVEMSEETINALLTGSFFEVAK